MARPTITYNSSSGSSSASGTGETLITGSSATVSGGDPGTLISLDGSPDLSELTVDESAILLSGIGLYRITAFDDGAKTVTIHTSVSLGSGVSWGIGGVRDGLRSSGINDENTGEGGWTWQFETGTYDNDADSYEFIGGDDTGGRTIVKAATGHVPVFSSTTHCVRVRSAGEGHITFDGISFYVITGGTSGIVFTDAEVSGTIIKNCIFGGTANSNYGIRVNIGSSLMVINCTFNSGVQYGVGVTSGNISVIHIVGCLFTSGSRSILLTGSSASPKVICQGCVFADAVSDCIYVTSDLGFFLNIDNSVFYNLNQAAIRLHSSVQAGDTICTVRNTVFDTIGSYGIYNQLTGSMQASIDYCAYYNVGTSLTYIAEEGDNNIALSTRALVDPANGNYALNTLEDGGNLCRGAGLGLGDNDIGLQSVGNPNVLGVTFNLE